MHVVTLGLESESVSKHRTQNKTERELGPGLDLEFETEMQSQAPEPAQYETVYVTAHKGPCRAGAFSPDGQLCATGSQDASIKILDVDRMLAKSSQENKNQQQAAGVQADQAQHPVIRTLYDHLEVNINILRTSFYPKMTFEQKYKGDFLIRCYDINFSFIFKKIIADVIL